MDESTCLDLYTGDVKCKLEEKVTWRRHFVKMKEVAGDRQRSALNLVRERMKNFLDSQIKWVSSADPCRTHPVLHGWVLYSLICFVYLFWAVAWLHIMFSLSENPKLTRPVVGCPVKSSGAFSTVFTKYNWKYWWPFCEYWYSVSKTNAMK